MHVAGAIVHMLQGLMYTCFRGYCTHVEGAFICMFQGLLYACLRKFRLFPPVIKNDSKTKNLTTQKMNVLFRQ